MVRGGGRHHGVGERDVELAVLGGRLVHLVEGVLQYAHLPHVLGRVRLVQHELDTAARAGVTELLLFTNSLFSLPVFETLALYTEVFLMVDKIGYFIPFEKLWFLAVAFPHANT